MTVTNWKGGSGNWQNASNWTAGAPTTPASYAVINAPGTYTVTIGSGLEYHVGAVWLNAAGAKLAIAGILDLTNKLTVSTGTLAVSGTIRGGTVVSAGGAIKFQNATLDGVTYNGTLDLATGTGTITVKDGLNLRGVKGRGAGALTLGGSSQIAFAGDQTLNGGTLTITGGTIQVSGTLTIGRSQKVQYKSAHNAFENSGSIVNRGSLNIGKGATISTGQIVNSQFVNSGKITVNRGGIFYAGTFTNTSGGTIMVNGGSLFQAGNSGTSAPGFDNAGTLTADHATINLSTAGGGSYGTLDITNSVVNLSDVESVGELNTLTTMLAGHGNQLTIALAIDNTGNTIELSTPSGFSKFTYVGSIYGGAVTFDAPFSGSLGNLDVQGAITIAGELVATDVTFSGAAGTGTGTIHLGGRLDIESSSSHGVTFDNALVIGAANSSIGGLGSFTVGSNATIKALGAFVIGKSRLQGISRFVRTNNEGTVEALGGTGTKVIMGGGVVENSGTIRVENGSTFEIKPHYSFANISSSTLTGGTYEIGAHSTLTVVIVSAAVTTLQANVTLEGVGAKFPGLGLATIGAQGALSLNNGATLSVAASFEIDGALNLGGSDFKSAQISIDAGGTLGGHGNVLGAIANSGLIDANGGTLSISQDVTGTGQSKIEDGATLQFGSDSSGGQTVAFAGAAGTLALGNAGGFDATIAGFAQGDTIDLINTKVGSVVYHAGSDTLSVKAQGKVIATLQLSGDYSGGTFGVASDGKGGSEITVTGLAPGALQRFTEARAAFSPSDMGSAATPTPTGTAWDSSHTLAVHG